MRIVTLTREFGESFGTEKVVFQSAHALKDLGHSVFVLAEKRLDASKALDGYQCIESLFSINRFSSARRVRRVREKLLEAVGAIKPDLLHLSEQLDARLIIPLIHRYKIVLTSHTVATTSPSSCRVINSDHICTRRSGWMCLWHNKRYGCLNYLKDDLRRAHALFEYQSRRNSHQRVHAILGPSRYICELLRAEGWPTERIHHVVNPVPPPITREISKAPENLLSAACRLVQMKGVDRLLRALSSLQHLPWTVWICGDGPQRESLVALTRKLSLQDRVVFKGVTDAAATHAIVANSVAYLQPNIGPESFGLAAAEASALGVPVVGFDVPGLNETILSDQTGILVPRRDEKGLANAIARLLADRKLAKQLGEAGRRYVAERFSVQAHIDATLKAYQAALSR